MSDPLAQLGLTLDLEEGDIVSDAVLIMKVHKPDGTVIVSGRSTDGTDWVTRRGLIAAAEDIEREGYVDAKDDDD
jgi:hypothetical protein